MWLVGSMALSFTLHFVILHVEVLSVSTISFPTVLFSGKHKKQKQFFFLNFSLQTVFQVTPLGIDAWIVVMKFSIPVVLLDEILKFAARKISDGENPIYTVHWIILSWAVFFGWIFFGPF